MYTHVNRSSRLIGFWAINSDKAADGFVYCSIVYSITLHQFPPPPFELQPEVIKFQMKHEILLFLLNNSFLVKVMCHAFSVCLVRSGGSAIETISLALRSRTSVWYVALRGCWTRWKKQMRPQRPYSLTIKCSHCFINSANSVRKTTKALSVSSWPHYRLSALSVRWLRHDLSVLQWCQRRS